MKQWLETREVFDRLAALGRAGMRAALATVVRVRGSAYRHEGAKLLVAEDESKMGNVSGGCLEQDVREVALQVLRSGRAELRTYCSGTDEIEAWDLGLGCEGQIDVFVELADERPQERARLDGRVPFAVCTVVAGPDLGRRLLVTHDAVEGTLGPGSLDLPVAAKARELLRAERSAVESFGERSVFIESLLPPPQLVLFGAGDDARPLAQFGADVGFRVVVVDHRPAYLAPDRFPVTVLRVETEPERLSERLTLDESCYAVVMTHSFAHDRAILLHLLRTPVPYIGMLGPRQRTERMLRELSEAAPELGRVYGPVGLDIGTDGAEQVALSVLAEILAMRSGRRPRSLRERVAPIHAYSE